MSKPGRAFLTSGFCILVLCLSLPAGPATVADVLLPSRNMTKGVHYVGSRACASCHAAIYKSFTQTGMGRSMALANDPSLADLPTPATVYDKDLGQYFEVQRKDGQWYQSQYALDNNGKELFRQTVKMQYAVGAGENGIGFVVERNGEHSRFLFEAPLSYYTQAHRWSFSPGYEIQNRGFSRPILTQCISCHSGQPKPVVGQVGLYQNPPFDELAIGCENCHGPGALHVTEHSSGQKATSPSIANPAHLSGWLADNICMRCHQGKDVRVNAPGMQDQDFRPGMPLDKVVSIFKLPADAQSPSGTALLEHYYGMTLSKCYRSTAGGLHCISCHDPHVEPSGEAAVSYYRARCLTCHNEQSCTLSKEKRLATSPADNCISCHMPKRTVATIAHGALTDHAIPAKEGAAPLPADAKLLHLSAPFGQREDLSSVPPLVLMQVYDTLTRDGYEEFRGQLDQLLDELARSQPTDSLVLRALARRAASQDSPSQPDRAMQYMTQAIRVSPANIDDLIFLAELNIGQKRIPEAVQLLEKARAMNPNVREIYALLGAQFMTIGDYRSALRELKAGIDLFPDDATLRALDQKARSATLDGIMNR
jgi:tetratricopeptide repeat protein